MMLVLTNGSYLSSALNLPTGDVLVIGIDAPQMYRARTNEWSGVSDSPISLGNYVNASLTMLPSGEFLAVGGGIPRSYWAMPSPGGTQALLNATLLVSVKEEEDGSIVVVAPETESVGAPRVGHTATRLQNGNVLIAGGEDYLRVFDEAKVYNAVTHAWMQAGSMLEPRSGHTATLLHSGEVLIVGGYDADSNALFTAELYDPSVNAWRQVGGMGLARYGHTATLLDSGDVLVTGGAGLLCAGEWYCQALSSTEIYSPTRQEWRYGTPMNEARVWHTASKLLDGRVLVIGGTDILPIQYVVFPGLGAAIYDHYGDDGIFQWGFE